jgi:hypothetical protein
MVLCRRDRGSIGSTLVGIYAASASSPARAANATQKETQVTARGSFDVKLVPQSDAGSPLGRMTIDKTFKGDLQGTSKGQMLAAGTAVKDSAGYVALEQVTGTLAGRSGTFILQHSGTMTRGVPTLTVSVVPDSGTGELLGLTGMMTIKVENGHFYEFNYVLPTK